MPFSRVPIPPPGALEVGLGATAEVSEVTKASETKPVDFSASAGSSYDRDLSAIERRRFRDLQDAQLRGD